MSSHKSAYEEGRRDCPSAPCKKGLRTGGAGDAGDFIPC